MPHRAASRMAGDICFDPIIVHILRRRFSHYFNPQMSNHPCDMDQQILRVSEISSIVAPEFEDLVRAAEESILGFIKDTAEDIRLLDGVERLAVLDTLERRLMGALQITQR